MGSIDEENKEQMAISDEIYQLNKKTEGAEQKAAEDDGE